jgi:polyferredoxin
MALEQKSSFSPIVLFLILIALVVALSIISSRLWGGKPEKIPEPEKWTITEAMTLEDFGRANNLPNPALKNIFSLKSRSDLQKKLSSYGTRSEIESLVTKNIALAAEHESKNWVKIVIKFILWFSFLFAVFFYFKNRKISHTARKASLLLSVLIFGVIMGSDPSPMGTVKDAIHLFATSGAVFPPRMIALTIFLLIVFAANKYICAWGCQVGVLQDLIFQINRTANGKAIIGKQIKTPFAITNGIRIAFFIIFIIVAFMWGLDITEPIDPFKLYKPQYLGAAGIIFVAALLISNLFFYRAWCHFFCPFGLVGWLVEKISYNKISVDYESCIACGKCATACPSTVMEAILKREKKTIPDCFACYACRDTCPTDSISFSARKRVMPPPGHFSQKRKESA